jgi:hypothetical protein
MVHHTDLRLVFQAFGGREREFNWLLTDFELNHYPPEIIPVLDRDEGARWFRGSELSDLVHSQISNSSGA